MKATTNDKSVTSKPQHKNALRVTARAIAVKVLTRVFAVSYAKDLRRLANS
jgi:hypothetical protein